MIVKQFCVIWSSVLIGLCRDHWSNYIKGLSADTDRRPINRSTLNCLYACVYRFELLVIPAYTHTHSQSLQPLFLLLLICEWTLHERCVRIWLGFAEGCVLICCSVFSSCALCCVSVLVCGCPWCWFVVAVAFVIAVVAFPWSVFLFPGSASCPRCQALYDAGHRGDAPVSLGQSEEKIRRGDCSAAGVLVCVRPTVYFWLPGCLIY